MSGQQTMIGVGAVVFRDDTALVIRRGKPPFLGHWSIPGGRLHYGEKLEDAVHREVMEETSITIRLISLINVFEAFSSDEFDQHIIMIDYAAEWVSGEPVAGDDAAAAEFVPIEEALERISWDKTRRAIAEALKLRNEALKRL